MPSADATESPPQIRAACYCRISSDPNDKREGVARQREDTAALCEVKGWEVAGVYIDNDRSASNGQARPEWERLLADIEAGKIDAVAAWDQDRVNRMMEDFERYKKVFVARRILLATSNSGDIDLSTPSGVLTAQIKTAVAEHEISMMKIRMRRAARQKAEKGKPQWKRAFGYLDSPSGPVPNPDVAPLVWEGYAAIRRGSSLKDVARMWNEAGALTEQWKKQRDEAGEIVTDPDTGKPVMVCTRKPWDESAVSAFIRKARNAGLRSHSTIGPDKKPHTEIVGKGNWEPLVDEALWRAVQSMMNARAGSLLGQRRPARRHLLSGLMICGKCGSTLRGQWVMTKTGGKPGRPKAGQTKEAHPGTVAHKVTYNCSGCHGVSIRADDVEPLLIGLIGHRLAEPDAVDLLKADVLNVADADRLREEKATLYGRLDEMAVERAQGLMTGRQLQVASEVIQQEIAALDRKEQDQEKLRIFDGIPVGTEQAVAAVKKLTPDRFRAVLSVLCTVTIEPVGKGSHDFNPDRVTVDKR